MIKQLLSHRSNSVTGGAIIIAAFTVLSTIFGILRDALLASKLGTSGGLDVYYAAFRIPDFLYNIFILGAISAGFIPVFTSYLHRSKEEASKLFTSILFLFGIVVGLLALILIIFAKPLLSIFLAGFSPEKIALAVSLTRLMMIQPLLLGLSSIIGSVLQVHRMFLINALAPVMYNLGIITGILVFYPLIGLAGLAYGVILGAFLNLIVQIPSFLGLKFQLRFRLRDSIDGMRKMIFIMIPRTLSILINQGYLLILTFVASYLKEGSIAVFNLANNIQNFPQSIFALSFTVAAFPLLSQLYAKGEKGEYVNVLNSTIRQILFFMLPIVCFFMVFRAQIVRLLLGYGRFDWHATIDTIDVLAIFILGMVFQSLINLLIRAFFGQEDSFRPFMAALFAYGLGAILCFILGIFVGVRGLAWAFVLANFLYCSLLIILLRRKLSNWSIRSLLKPISLMLVSAIVAGLVGYLMLYVVNIFVTTHKVFGIFIQAFVSGFVALLVYVALAQYFKIEEMKNIKEAIAKRFKNGKEIKSIEPNL